MAFFLRVFSAIERPDLVDFAIGFAIGTDSLELALKGKLAAGSAVITFAMPVPSHGKQGKDRTTQERFDFMFVDGRHG